MVSGKIYVRLIKPFFDVIAAMIIAIVFSPFLLLVSLIVFFDTKRFPVFSQTRIGLDESEFKLYKFRTMNIDYDESSMTRLGKVLRSTSIDDVPQLFNIIKGEMSFIGPRPLLLEYLPFYNEDERSRHKVKPGITGWAQVNGRNEIDWGIRMEKDIYYVAEVSFIMDLRILFLTFLLLLKRDKTPYGNTPTIKFSEYASKR